MLKKAMLWEKMEGKRVHCYLCSHHCKIEENGFGFCGMRQNLEGELYTYAYGKVIASHVDPIEKKPLYHFLPGTYAYSIATIGCNFRCPFCQNWTISQRSVKDKDMEGEELSPEEIAAAAEGNNCSSISYTYTEPTIFFEYAYDTAKTAKARGLYNNFVTNGFMTKEAIAEISPYLDAANIDLKFFSDDSYRRICKGSLSPVLDSIKNMKKAGIWVEVTTLIVPGENDSNEELCGIAEFLAETGKEIPWHISRFHPDYKYTDSYPTPLATMEKAREIGKKAGLKYIYLGNVYTRGETICPGCGNVLIERAGLTANISEDFLEGGKCRACGAVIEGIWE
ncbi:MAG: AmmeMemoRadiSam system radical SAM enzyme [Candidatus Makaraimicrobium thalassicum]|nr:MAG: AmmeMemoRadiSam system radical SAM enzyme [Candidatus Omnitrophota bacterium]